MQNKKAVVAVAVAIMLAIFAADVFFIKSNRTVFADYIAARAVELVVLLFTAKILKFNLNKRCLNRYGSYFELLYGILFSMASLLPVYGAELIYFKIVGYKNLNVSFVLPGYGNGQTETALVAYIAALLINACFQEIFRGFFIAQFGVGRKFKAINPLQACLCTAFSTVPFIAAWLEGDYGGKGSGELAMILGTSFLAGFIGAIKWGYYYRVNGSVWMAIADHFVNSFVLSCVFFSKDGLPDKWLLAKALVVQLASCVIFIPFYYRRDRANAEYAKEARLRREVLFSMKNRSADGDSEALDEMLLMMNDSNQNKKFGTSASNEIQSLDKSPAELSGEFFESFVGTRQTQKSSAASTDSTVNSEAEISRLVGNFFEQRINR